MHNTQMMSKTQEIRVDRKKILPHYRMEEAHFHTYHELYYMYRGSCDTFIGKTLYHITEGDLLLVPHMEIHKTTNYSDSVNERIIITFTPEYMSMLINEYGEEPAERFLSVFHVSVPQARRKYLEDLLDRIVLESRHTEEDFCSRLLTKLYICEVLCFLYRCSQFRETEDRKTPLDAHCLSAVEYINAHFNEQLTLEQVAKHVNLSPTYLSRRFKRETSFGFKEYLLEVRMKEASVMLLETDKTITVIANACGFDDSNYFSGVFRKFKGVTPRQYRKMQQLI